MTGRHARPGEDETGTRDDIIAKLAGAFPGAAIPPDGPASAVCMTVFTDTDGENSTRALTFGEIADALAGT